MKVIFLLFLLGIVSLTHSFTFSTSGKKLMDGSTEFRMRGISMSGTEYQTVGGEDFEYVNLNTLTTIKRTWNPNVIRVPLNQGFYLRDADYRTRINNIVDWIQCLGMGAILDLHWSIGSGGSYNQRPMPDSESNTFWNMLANNYKHNLNVIFEIYNEPYIYGSTNVSIWKNGGVAVDDKNGGTTYNAVGHQTLYNTVRATGAQNVVLVNGVDYGYGLQSLAIDGATNLAYGSHLYYEGEGTTKDLSQSRLDEYVGNPAALLNAPIIVTEFGRHDGVCSTSQYQTILEYMEAKQWGWTAWAWFPKAGNPGCAFPSIVLDTAGQPNVVGAVVKPYVLLNGQPNANAVCQSTGVQPTPTTGVQTTGVQTTGVQPTLTTGVQTTSTTGASTQCSTIISDYTICGGSNYNGPATACCASTSQCVVVNSYHSQCEPSSGSSPSSGTTTTTGVQPPSSGTTTTGVQSPSGCARADYQQTCSSNGCCGAGMTCRQLGTGYGQCWRSENADKPEITCPCGKI